jgi:Zn-dependent protease with chaperone function
MYLAVYLPIFIPVLAALAARPLADRLPPAAATWLLAGSALALAAASSAVLGLLALTAVGRVPLLDSLSNVSATIMTRDDPASLPVAIVAGALLTAAAVAAGRAAYRRVRAIVAAGRQAQRLPGSGQVVVTDDEAADAYTLPGWPCRIVITSGMLRALSDPERRVLLAHERSHARRAHYLFTSVARLAAAANPLLRPVAAEVGFTVERWADEHAARVTGDRPLTARAVAHAAMATSASPPERTAGLSALGIISDAGRASDTMTVSAIGRAPGGSGGSSSRASRELRRAGPVPRRVAALLAPAPRPRLVLFAVALLLVALSGVSALEAAKSMHQLIEYAQAAAHH